MDPSGAGFEAPALPSILPGPAEDDIDWVWFSPWSWFSAGLSLHKILEENQRSPTVALERRVLETPGEVQQLLSHPPLLAVNTFNVNFLLVLSGFVLIFPFPGVPRQWGRGALGLFGPAGVLMADGPLHLMLGWENLFPSPSLEPVDPYLSLACIPGGERGS